MRSCCKRKADVEQRISWCSCCGVPVNETLGEEMRRGGDGWWYCMDCWVQWWTLEDEGSSKVPFVSRVVPKWCSASDAAVSLCFPPRTSLLMNSGGLDVVTVDAQNTSEAVRSFFEHGFVVLRRALQPGAVEDVLRTCRAVSHAVSQRDPQGLGNRGRGRYSFHHVVGPGQCFHLRAYSHHLVDNSAVLDFLDAVYVEAHKRRRQRLQKQLQGASGSESQAEYVEPEQKYFVTGAGGDYCEGWVREFQPLHSDYGRARPLRGPPWWAENDFPVHDKDMPPMISANYIVQPLHRWNGATRLIPWSAMNDYVSECSNAAASTTKDEVELPPHLTRDSQTFHYHKKDVEVAPLLVQEFERRPLWLSSRSFPLDAGDVLVRDVRVWHGGCPNLSREARYLPGVEFSSSELVEHFADRGYEVGWPQQKLPAVYAKTMSMRAQKLCSKVIAEENDGFVSEGLEDFDWLKNRVGFPAKRNHFLPEVHLGLEQCEAISLRACLEQLTLSSQQSKEISGEQAAWLQAKLEQLRHVAAPSHEANATTTDVQTEDTAQLASALLDALCQGKFRAVFNDDEQMVNGTSANDNDKVRAVASKLMSCLEVNVASPESAEANGCEAKSKDLDRQVKRRTAGL